MFNDNNRRRVSIKLDTDAQTAIRLFNSNLIKKLGYSI